MTRCASPLAALIGLALFFGALAPAAAQGPRPFPATALRGDLVVTAPPEVALNKQPARLAPGARIRDASNRILLSGQVVGRPLLVHYTLDLQGQLLDVWVLTAAEAARKPWPSSRAEAASWRFDAAAQTWSKP